MIRRNQQIRLSDGRQLGYDDRGPLDGRPVFYFHGAPSSRLESYLYVPEAVLQSLNVRLIAADRPGMGLSGFQPGRSLLSWSTDVLALADHFKIDRFAILAYSLGGPYGAACAYAIPDRLSHVGIVSGAGLFAISELAQTINEGTRKFLYMPREHPRLSRLYLWMMLRVMPRIAPEVFASGAKSLLPEADSQIVLSSPQFQKGFVTMVREATRQGIRGAYHESLLSVTEWGFPLTDIQIPLSLWHGEADRNVPVDMARYMAANIPGCDVQIYPNEGHLSLFKKQAEEILRTLVYELR